MRIDRFCRQAGKQVSSLGINSPMFGVLAHSIPHPQAEYACCQGLFKACVQDQEGWLPSDHNAKEVQVCHQEWGRVCHLHSTWLLVGYKYNPTSIRIVMSEAATSAMKSAPVKRDYPAYSDMIMNSITCHIASNFINPTRTKYRVM